ncbi:unannotated protein [freshwater metagenome]|uniref:Unannotated protein n=1 Tax=freshwater metagenome TaxID=449393 RepID=A0A6J7CV15_9ZZZZ
MLTSSVLWHPGWDLVGRAHWYGRVVGEVSWAPNIDDRFIPARSQSVVTIELDQEVVLLDESGQTIHALNPVGALIWACIDGTSQLGEICADLADAVGAPLETVRADTQAIVARLAELGMITDAGLHIATPPPTPSNRHEQPIDRVEEADGTTGQTMLTVEVAGQSVGVATNDTTVLHLLRDALGPALTSVPSSVADVFLHVGTAPGRLMAVHYLSVRGERVVRTSNLGRLVRASLRHLEGFVPRTDDLVLTGRLMVHDRGAVIIRASFGCLLELGDRGLARAGWRTLDQPATMVDAETLDVVTAAPSLQCDPAGLEEIERQLPIGRDELRAIPQRLPLLGLVSVGYLAAPDGEVETPAQQLTRRVQFVNGAGPVRGSDLQQLARVVARVPTYWLTGHEPRGVTDLLGRLASGPRRSHQGRSQPHRNTR